eukprot:3939664-Rhodomonas_salina.1
MAQVAVFGMRQVFFGRQLPGASVCVSRLTQSILSTGVSSVLWCAGCLPAFTLTRQFLLLLA